MIYKKHIDYIMAPRATKVRGGELLGEGAFGCVFEPRIPCSDESTSMYDPSSGHVGKVIRDHDEFAKELSILNYINTVVDPTSKFTNKLVKSCQVYNNAIRRTQGSDALKCEFVARDDPNTVYGQIVQKHRATMDFEQYLASPDTKMFDAKGVQTWLDLAQALKQLAMHELCHYDLKPANILVTDNNKPSFLLNDFGKTTKFDTVYVSDPKKKRGPHGDYYEANRRIGANAQVLPPELQLAAYHAQYTGRQGNTPTPKRSLEWYKEACKTFVEDNYAPKSEFLKSWTLYFIFVGITRQDFVDQFHAYAQSFANLWFSSTNEEMNDLYRSIARKVDVFGFGVMVMLCISEQYRTRPNAQWSTEEIYIRDEFMRIARGCMHGNPLDRMSVDEVIEDLTRLKRTKGAKPIPLRRPAGVHEYLHAPTGRTGRFSNMRPSSSSSSSPSPSPSKKLTGLFSNLRPPSSSPSPSRYGGKKSNTKTKLVQKKKPKS